MGNLLQHDAAIASSSNNVPYPSKDLWKLCNHSLSSHDFDKTPWIELRRFNKQWKIDDKALSGQSIGKWISG